MLTYFVDEDLGPDSLGFGLASLGLYLSTLTVLIGYDEDPDTQVVVSPTGVFGRF